MGASHPDEMVARAKQLGYRGLALCDVNGLYGVARGFQAAEKPSHFDAEQVSVHQQNGLFRYHVGAELTPMDAAPIALLPTAKEGYSCLSRLITHSKRPAGKGRLKLTLDEVLESAGHVSGELLAFPLPPWREGDLDKMVEAFGSRLYLPICKDATWESVALARQALALERRYGGGLKLFATQRPLFHGPERKPLHDVLTCLLHKTTLAAAKTKLTANAERHLKPLAELRQLYRDRPDLLTRTLEISDRLTFSLRELRYKYPQEALPAGLSSTQFLRQLTEAGLLRRYGEGAANPAVRKQVEHELALIADLEYEDYFLTLWDICQFASSRKILHQGRGSAANSIVCYAIGLTAIDPIKLGLLFERFLSKERGEPPDIDIDFEHERREEVIQYIYGKYGAEHAAMVCTTICYRSRMAIREVAKVLGVATPAVDQMVKHMGREGMSRLHEATVDPAMFGLSQQTLQLLLARAAELQGFPRHLGIHSGGFVISHTPVVDIVPVEAATMTDRYVIQWNKDDVNLLGLMKIDILSLGMLSAIRKALAMLQEKKGIAHDLASVPQDDAPTYAMIQKADTIGVFQIESRAQMSLLPRLKPKNYYDLVVEVAIVRPGPIQGGMVHPYLKRRSGQEKVTYAHPLLKPILEKTLGIPIFQEQIMQIAVAVAGFTPGESDELRRVVSSAWKRKAVMHGLRQRIINGMLANKISVDYAEQIYRTIEGFAAYGFPESHAASFALLTYVSCWLKCHHPDIFSTALLNSQPMGFYPPRQLISDAERHGTIFHPLDLNFSDWDYTVEKPWHVRIGLRAVDGLRQDDAKRVIDERKKNGPYSGVEDLVRRSRLPKRSLARLITAGALRCPQQSTRQQLYSLQGIDFRQQSLFYGTESLRTELPQQEPPGAASSTSTDDGRQLIPLETDWETVVREYQTKGFSLDLHPMGILRRHFAAQFSRHQTARDLSGLRNGARVNLIGLKSLLQKPPTAKGLCFVSLEDETGIFNLILMPEVYQRFRLVLFANSLLDVRGKLQSRSGVIHIMVENLEPALKTSALIAPKVPALPTYS